MNADTPPPDAPTPETPADSLDESPSPASPDDADAALCDVLHLAGEWESALPDAEALLARAATAALDGLPAAARPSGPAEVSLVLADDAHVRDLNRDYRGKDKATNVLSFAAGDDAAMPDVPGAPVLLGDVVLALETLTAEARAQGKTLADHAAHLSVHGVLHLLGYDHELGAEAAAEMEALEIAILAGLHIADPYAVRSAAGDAALQGGEAVR